MPARESLYEVRSERPQQVRDALLQMWRNLEVRGDLQAKFNWSYEQAPSLPDTVFVLRSSGQVVGSMGFGVRRFRVGGQDRQVAVLADLSVSPEHRSLAPALSLVKTARDYTGARFDCAYGWPNSKAEAVFVRARYKALGRVVRYARVARYDAYVDRAGSYAERLSAATRLPQRITEFLTRRPIATLGANLLDGAGRLKGLGAVWPVQRHHQLSWVGLTDPRIDELWTAARDEYKIVGERTTRFLHWRFSNDSVRVALLTRRSDGKCCAYAVVRCENGEAQIADVFGHVDCLSALLALLFKAMCADKSVHVVSCAYLGSPKFIQALEDNGFERRDEKGRSVCISHGVLPSALQPDLERAEHWHLTACDEDV